MTYTPYTNEGQCKTADEVSSDISRIAFLGFSAVRIYATDCDALPNVGAACSSHGMKVILGVFIGPTGISDAQNQVDDICSWGQEGNWGMVDLIVVGNEAIFNEYVTSSELAGFINSAKSSFQGAGYSGMTTTTEPLNVLTDAAKDLCSVMDAVAANIQPFFNSAVTAANAGSFVQSQLELVGDLCPGLPAYNLESGWPSSGNANGDAVPGFLEQATAVLGIVSEVGDKSVIFSFQDDGWKGPGQFNVEQHFGCSDHF